MRSHEDASPNNPDEAGEYNTPFLWGGIVVLGFIAAIQFQVVRSLV